MARKRIKKAAVQIFAVSLAVGSLPMNVLAAEQETAGFIQEFQQPTKATQANIRYWLKGAHIDEQLVDADMKAISEAGFSTVEVINKGGSTEDLSEYGWGTEEWQNATEIIINKAKEYGLSVDFTIGPTWPAAIPTLDANDAAASQELVYSVQQISSADFTQSDGVRTYTCPVPAGPESETEQTLIAVVYGKLTGEQRTDYGTYYAPPSGTRQDVEFTVDILDEDSLTAVTPDENGEVSLQIGTDADGDYLLFAFYSQGTGQTVSGSTDPDAVCIDHYSQAGTDALLAYWEENILDDTLTEYLQENGGDLFEDSLELSINLTPWTQDLLELFEESRGYDLTKYLPMLVHRFYSASNVSSGEGEKEEDIYRWYGFADSSDTKIVEDFNELLNSLYQENHLQVIQEWAEAHNMNYRVQAYSGYDTGHYDSNQAGSIVGTIEGESLAFMESHDGVDSFRVLSGGAHMAGKQVISDELGAVFFGTYQVTFDTIAELVNKNAAGGANQFVLHGYPSSSETDAEQWPGYHPFSFIFSEPWDDRQPVWDSMDILSNYLARTQEILQEGTAKVDIAIYRDEKTIKTQYFDSDCLTVNGYSYEFLSDGTLLTEQAAVTDGILAPDSAAYKALVLYEEGKLSAEMAERLNEFADSGLPIIIIGEAPSQGKYFIDSDETIAQSMAELLAKENVYQIETAGELPAALEAAGVEAAARYERNMSVHSLHRVSDSGDYYWLYNYGTDAVELPSCYEGSGNVYQLNLWDGSVTKLDTDQTEEGRLSLTLALEAGEATALLITEEEIPQAAEEAQLKEAYAVLLADADWSLEAESYTAAEEGSPETAVTEITAELDGLKSWNEVPGLETVSGNGVYETTFQVESLEGVGKALLKMETASGTMAVTQVLVNGQDAGTVDQSRDSVDITAYLAEGENTISIRISTTLANAANSNSESAYGLLDAQIVLSK